MKTLLVALILSLALSGCAVCKSLEQRCNGAIAEQCDSAGKWRPVMDCSKLKPMPGKDAPAKHVCKQTGTTAGCKPQK